MTPKIQTELFSESRTSIFHHNHETFIALLEIYEPESGGSRGNPTRKPPLSPQALERTVAISAVQQLGAREVELWKRS